MNEALHGGSTPGATSSGGCAVAEAGQGSREKSSKAAEKERNPSPVVRGRIEPEGEQTVVVRVHGGVVYVHEKPRGIKVTVEDFDVQGCDDAVTVNGETFTRATYSAASYIKGGRTT